MTEAQICLIVPQAHPQLRKQRTLATTLVLLQAKKSNQMTQAQIEQSANSYSKVLLS
jgi:hypothetical protein